MKKDILLAIAKATREIPVGQFDMDVWKAKGRYEAGGCNTVFCAIGNAVEKGIIPGLVWNRTNVPALEGDQTIYSYTAVASALEITGDEAVFLFHAEEYFAGEDGEDENVWIHPSTVADRIEEFVREAYSA